MKSAVESPNHYCLYEDKNALNGSSFETIDVILAALGKEGTISFCKGNIIKYKMRAGLKGTPEQDIKKAGMYNTYLKKLTS